MPKLVTTKNKTELAMAAVPMRRAERRCSAIMPIVTISATLK